MPTKSLVAGTVDALRLVAGRHLSYFADVLHLSSLFLSPPGLRGRAKGAVQARARRFSLLLALSRSVLRHESLCVCVCVCVCAPPVPKDLRRKI